MQCINTTGHHTCSGVYIDSKISLMMHYRKDVSPDLKGCNTPNDPIKCTIQDRTAWRYFDVLKTNVDKQLEVIFE